MYKIADYHGEELEGTFYKQELQNIIKKDSDFYRIENVIRYRICGNRREYLVKWLGYSNDSNSWVPGDNVYFQISMYFQINMCVSNIECSFMFCTSRWPHSFT